MSSSLVQRYRARWLFPGNAPPLEHATIEIEEGRIRGVGTEASDATNLGDVAILPGLINAHTHLEFSSISLPLEPLRTFPEWIKSVIRWRSEFGTQPEAAIRTGLNESLLAGVTSIAEIATTDWRFSQSILEAQSLPTSLLMFREYLGLSDEAVESQLQDAKNFLNSQSDNTLLPGLSPHAPYSLHPALFDGLCTLAEKHQVPLAMHLAESPAEIELLLTGGGKLAEMLTEIGVYRSEFFNTAQRPIDFLARLDCGVPVVIVHGNLLNEEELLFLSSRPQMSVVYCPRTHAAMQCSSHPWQRMIELGINVALGTDSRASNPDLSIWNELCFLSKSDPAIPSSALLQLATSNAAQALDLSDEGKLAAGYAANLVIVPLQETELENLEASLFTSKQAPLGIMQRGKWIVQPGETI